MIYDTKIKIKKDIKHIGKNDKNSQIINIIRGTMKNKRQIKASKCLWS